MIVIVLSRQGGPGKSSTLPDNSGIDILLLVSRDYGANYFLNSDRFEQYGWNMLYSGVLKEIPACPPYYYHHQLPTIVPDFMNGDIKNVDDFDALAIMPATAFFTPIPFDEFINDPGTLELISSAVSQDIPMSSMCAGARVLAAADVIRGAEIVGNPKFQHEYESAGATFLGKDHPPATHGCIITAGRDMYYSRLNCQAIATAVEDRQPTGIHENYPDIEFIFSDTPDFPIDSVVWARTFGGFAADGGHSICETENSGYLLTGYTFSHGTGDADLLVLKTDPRGKKIWAKTFGGAGSEYGYDCITVDDGYLITGYTTSFGNGSKDVYLVRIDQMGNELWTKSYGGEKWDVGNALCRADDGGFIICGFTHSTGAGEEDIYVIKTDADGNEIWSRTYGEKRFEIGNSVCAVPGGYLIGATTGTTEGGNSDYYLLKIDRDGKELWSKKYATNGSYGHGFDWCNSMRPAPDGGFVLCGYSDCEDIMNAHVIKTDAEGNEIWSRTFGTSKFYDYGNSVCIADDGAITVVGTAKKVDSVNIYNNDFYVVSLDADGNVLREQVVGGDSNEWGSMVCPADNGDIILVGQTRSKLSDSFDVCLLKISAPI